MTEAKLAELVARAVAVEGGTEASVRIVGSWLMPADEVAFVLVETQTLEDACAFGGRAGLPFERIVETIAVEPASAL